MDRSEASFDGTPQSGSAARRFTRDALAGHPLGDVADDAVLCVAELAANAILHARGPYSVAVAVDGTRARIEVTDTNTGRVPVAVPLAGSASDITRESATGRGLRVVATLATRWGVDISDTAKTVWCELDGSGAGGAADPIVNDARRHGAPGLTVTLIGLPVRAAIGSGMQVDELVREFQLGLFDDTMTDAQRSRFWELLDASAPARLAGRAGALEAAGLGMEWFDVDIPIDAESAAAVSAFRELLELLPSRVDMTGSAPTPDVVAFREWLEDEVGAQLAGAAPTPYPGSRAASPPTAASSAQRLERLQTIATALSTLLTPEEVADVILRDVAPELGGAGRALWMLDEDGTELRLVHPEKHTRAAPFAGIPIDSPLPGAHVARTGEPLFLTTVEERNARFPQLANVGPQVSIAVLPLTASGRVIGVLACSHDEEHEFSPDERRYLMVVSALASHALERARLHGRQVEVAHVLQASLLPPELPAVEGIELAAAYRPALEGTEVGGDFYDVFPLPGEGRWALAVGDVSGTGPEAAAVTAQVRHTLRAATRIGYGTAAALAVVNDTLVESLAPERFCTMVLCSIVTEGDGAVLKVIVAGHPAPVVVRGGGAVEEVRGEGPLLGALPDARFEPVRVELARGDAVVLFTDGVIEARSATVDDAGRRGFFDVSGLVEAVRPVAGESAKQIVGAVEAALLDYTGGHLLDDVAVLVLRASA